MALLHADPAPGDTLIADVEVPPGQSYGLVATWPDAETSQVTHYRFDDVPAGTSGRASLILRPNAPPMLTVEGTAQEVSPTTVERENGHVGCSRPGVVGRNVARLRRGERGDDQPAGRFAANGALCGGALLG